MVTSAERAAILGEAYIQRHGALLSAVRDRTSQAGVALNTVALALFDATDSVCEIVLIPRCRKFAHCEATADRAFAFAAPKRELAELLKIPEDIRKAIVPGSERAFVAVANDVEQLTPAHPLIVCAGPKFVVAFDATMRWGTMRGQA